MKLLPAAPSMRFVLREEPIAEYDSRVMDDPAAIYEFHKKVIQTDENYETNKEHLIVLLLNSRLRMTGYTIVSKGSLNETVARTREVLRPVIVGAAHGFIMMHNHPSGDPSPSRADEIFTRRLIEAANLMETRFLDHVIVGTPADGRLPYFSFRECGILV